jgi:hypothetical protein
MPKRRRWENRLDSSLRQLHDWLQGATASASSSCSTSITGHKTLIKSDLRRRLRRVNVFVERAVRVVTLLLDSSAELHQLLGHGLVGSLKDVDQTVKC